MLIGLRDIFEVGAIEIGTFFVSVSVIRRSDNLMLEIMGIYGPTDHSLLLTFLEEISAKIARIALCRWRFQPYAIRRGQEQRQIQLAKDRHV
jgi:hypothetical protein